MSEIQISILYFSFFFFFFFFFASTIWGHKSEEEDLLQVKSHDYYYLFFPFKQDSLQRVGLGVEGSVRAKGWWKAEGR